MKIISAMFLGAMLGAAFSLLIVFKVWPILLPFGAIGGVALIIFAVGNLIGEW